MSNPTYPSATYQSEPNLRRPDRRPIWLISLVTVAGIAALGLILGRQEIARWHYAAAANALQDGQVEDAVDAANRGLSWNPEYAELIRLRAVAHLEQEAFEACITDFDQILEIAARDEEVTEADIAPLAGKANALQRLDRYDEALRLWDDIVDFRKRQYRLRDDSESLYAYAMALNNRSYIQGQAFSRGVEDIDIGKALEDIREALRIHEQPNDAVLVDTLGYLLLLNEQPKEAFEALDRAVRTTRQIRSEYKLAPNAAVQQAARKELKRMDEHFAVILYHRGQAYEALGDLEKASADMTEAEQLGYDPAKGVW